MNIAAAILNRGSFYKGREGRKLEKEGKRESRRKKGQHNEKEVCTLSPSIIMKSRITMGRCYGEGKTVFGWARVESSLKG